jgi:transposase
MIRRVADQIGCGVESLRTWVKQADIDDGVQPGLTSVEAKRIRKLEENRELRRANDLLKRASAFFAAELCATRRDVDREVVRDHFRWAVAAA